MPFDNKNSGQAIAQLIAEQKSPVADVVYLGVSSAFQATDKGLVEPYKPAHWNEIPANMKDPQGHWFAIHSGTLGLFVNKDALDGKPVPRSWADLLKPEYKGMIGYLDPASAFVGYAGAVAVNQALGGSLDNFKPALDWFRKLRANQPIVPKQTAYARVLSGEIPILIDYDFDAYRAEYKDHANVAFVIPAEGTISVPYVMSLGEERAARGQRPEGARLRAVRRRPEAVGQCLPAPGARAGDQPRGGRQVPAGQRLRARQAGRLRQDGGGPAGLRPAVPADHAMRSDGEMRDLSFPLRWRLALLAPALAVFTAFWLLPMVVLVRVSAEDGFVSTYLALLANARYMKSLASTVALSAAVTLATLALSTLAGLLLARREFAGKRALVALLTFPLAFPGVVVGFMVIMLAGRQGLIGMLSAKLTGDKWVFAYSVAGLFVGYLYFSIPRVIVTVIASASKLDPSLEEARALARRLGLARVRRHRAARAGAGPDRLGRDLLRHLDGRVRHRLHAGHRARRAADDDLHRVHAEREHRHRRRPVDRARHRHLGGARARAQPDRAGRGRRLTSSRTPPRP